MASPIVTTPDADPPPATPRRRLTWRDQLRRLAVLLTIAVFGWWMLGCTMERALLYPARFFAAPPELVLPPHAERLVVEHEQGRTFAHLYLGNGVDADRPGPVVLYAHGNGELIEDYPDGLPGWQERGISVLLVEYRGCGRSDGSPTKTRIVADHVAFYDQLVQHPAVDADRIIFHGRSMGGGIVSAVALERRPAALVLESAYSSITDFARRMLFPAFIVRDRYDVTATLRSYDGPVVIAHSPRDEIIPFAMAQKNRAAAPDAYVIDLLGGHNEPMADGFFDAVYVYLARQGVLGADAAPPPAGP
jgi:pimeloyl-ACP methyl ester carboxylesterase